MRIATGQIELRTPPAVVWGILRSEPARLAWGIGLGDGTFRAWKRRRGMIPVSGGMPGGIYGPKEGEAALPEVHAGDEVSVAGAGEAAAGFFRDGRRV